MEQFPALKYQGTQIMRRKAVILYVRLYPQSHIQRLVILLKRNMAGYSEHDGFMKFRAPHIEANHLEDSAATAAVLEATVIGLKQIELSYGTEYIKVID